MLAAIVAFTIGSTAIGAYNAGAGDNQIHGDAPCEVQTAVKGKAGNVLYYTCHY